MARVIPSLYRHEQPTALATWTIVHNLGGNGSLGIPIIDITVNNNGVFQKLIAGNTQMVDANTVVVSFSEPRAGFAVVIA